MRYHSKTITLLGLSNEPTNKALQLPASVSEWYSRSDAVSLLREYSNDDAPLEPSQFELVSDDKLNFIVFMYENQGVCWWAYVADDSEDPPVYINLDPPPNKWFLHAETFSTFIYTRVFDFWNCRDSQLGISGSGDPLSEDTLQRLQSRYKEEPRTHGWTSGTQYRFSRPGRRIVIWDSPKQADWHFSADTSEAVVLELYREFSQNLLWHTDLPVNSD
jgi:hypothetical protein